MYIVKSNYDIFRMKFYMIYLWDFPSPDVNTETV